jgi:DNA-binding response OmpR family regulator
VAERQVRLTLTEVRLLLALAHHRGRAVHRNTLLESVWGRDVATPSSRLSMAVSRLRAKIGFERIRTIRGWGYTFNTSSLEDREYGPTTRTPQ